MNGSVIAKYNKYKIADSIATQFMSIFSPAAGLNRKEHPVINIITGKKYAYIKMGFTREMSRDLGWVGMVRDWNGYGIRTL